MPALTKPLRDHGTAITKTTPNSSQQNGTVEGSLRQKFNAARAALRAASMPLKYRTCAAAEAICKESQMPHAEDKSKVRSAYENFMALSTRS